jgi:hypothetical protein
VSAWAQSEAATLEFTVRATPSGGRAEKVMRQPFFLLRRSLGEIDAEARAQVAAPELETFASELPASGALKAWIQRTKITKFSGPDFHQALTVDDVMDVPEFRAAYIARNQVMVGLGFPRRKAKLTDRERNPKKWEESEARYWLAVRNYLALHPESKDGMEEHLLEVNPEAAWRNRLERHERVVRQKVLELIHTRYLAGQTETDYEGFARFAGLAPGRYWLTNLWNEVRAGDVQLRWELPLDLRPGRTFYLELTNANARMPAASR